MKILFVDTRNVCGSASAAATMRSMAQAWGMPDIRVTSAGTSVSHPLPGCSQAPALQGVAHASQPVMPDLVDGADLILACSHDCASEMTIKAPHARNKVFTLRQAGRWSNWMLERGFVQAAHSHAADPAAWRASVHGVTRSVTPLPTIGGDPAAWAVIELDACRGVGPTGHEQEAPRFLAKLLKPKAGGPPLDPDDLPNPHKSDASHQDAYEAEVQSIGSVLRFLAAAGVGRG